MPLGGGSLPEPGTEGSVFKSPLFVTVSVSGRQWAAGLTGGEQQWRGRAGGCRGGPPGRACSHAPAQQAREVLGRARPRSHMPRLNSCPAICLQIPGPTEEALAIAQAAEPQYVNNRKYGAHGIPLQDTLAPHQASAQPALRAGSASAAQQAPGPERQLLRCMHASLRASLTTAPVPTHPAPSSACSVRAPTSRCCSPTTTPFPPPSSLARRDLKSAPCKVCTAAQAGWRSWRSGPAGWAGQVGARQPPSRQLQQAPGRSGAGGRASLQRSARPPSDALPPAAHRCWLRPQTSRPSTRRWTISLAWSQAAPLCPSTPPPTCCAASTGPIWWRAPLYHPPKWPPSLPAWRTRAPVSGTRHGSPAGRSYCRRRRRRWGGGGWPLIPPGAAYPCPLCAAAGINPLGPSMIYTGLESPTRSPGSVPPAPLWRMEWGGTESRPH